MLSCKQVASQAGDITRHRLPTWRQRLGVWLHLLVCHHCRRYLRQVRLMQAFLQRRQRQQQDEEAAAAVLAAVQAANASQSGAKGKQD